MTLPVQTCYRHPGRQAGIICQRCDRPICPECMNQASVGFHCPECTKSGKQKVIRGPGAFVSQPVVTQVLMAVNVAMFLIGSAVDKRLSIGMDGRIGWWEIHLGLFTRGVLRGETVGVGAGQVYRIITAGFMHGGLLHLAVNMYALWILGRVMEHVVGRLRVAIIYGVALVAGGLGALLLSPDAVTVGASGAIFGLMGALLVIERLNGIPILRSALLPTLVINVVISVGVPGISIGGHLGGFLGGGLAGWILLDWGRRPGVDKRIPYSLCAAVAVACLIGAFVFSSGYTPT